jgi:hypothetical protein
MAISLTATGVQFPDNSVRTTARHIRYRDKAIFAFGYDIDGQTSVRNLVSNTGLVAASLSGSGDDKGDLAAAGYGGDKAIFGYGFAGTPVGAYINETSLVSNTGVIATETTGVGTSRSQLAAAGYGGDKAIFGYGRGVVVVPTILSLTNRVSNTGVVSADTTGVGTARAQLAAAGYGGDKAIFGYGIGTSGGFPALLSLTNRVSNTGVVSADTTGVGTARRDLAAAGYGDDKAIFGYGNTGSVSSLTNLVSNTGVVATDTTGVGTARYLLAAAGYGGDKAIFGYGYTTGNVSLTNLVSNTGVVSADTTGVGTARNSLAAAGFGS